MRTILSSRPGRGSAGIHAPLRPWLAGLLLTAALGLPGLAQSPSIDWAKTDGGGGTEGTAGVFSLLFTVGAHDAEERRAVGPYALSSGFHAIGDEPSILTVFPQTNVIWNNVVGEWSVAANWTPSTYYPNNGNGGYDYDVNISGGVATLTEDITIDKLTFEWGTVEGSGNLIVNDLFTFPRGELGGPGWRSFRGGAAVTSSGWARNFRSGTIINAPGSTFALNADVSTGQGSAFMNRGVFQQAASLDGNLGGSSVFSNLAGGLVLKDSPGESIIGIPFVNAGSNRVLSGTQRLSAITTNTGHFHVAGGAVLYLKGPATYMDAGSSWTGDGTLLLDGNSALVVNDGSQFSPGTLQSDGGGIVWNSDATLQNVVNFSTWYGDGAVTINGNFNWSKGEILPGQGAVTLLGKGVTDFDWAGGKNLRGRTFNIQPGATLEMQASWGIGGGGGRWGALQNWGTLRFPYDLSIHHAGGAAVVSNKSGGLILKTSPGNASIGVPVINKGTISVNVGKFSLNLGGTNSGNFDVASGAVLDLRQTNYWDNGASWTGDGTLLLDGAGALVINDGSDFTPPLLETYGTVVYKDHVQLKDVLFGGVWQGSGKVEILGSFNWPYSGSLQSGGTITLRGVSTTSGAWIQNIRGRTIENHGTWNWAVTPGWGFSTGDGTYVINQGVLNIQTDLYYSGEGGGDSEIYNQLGGVINKTSTGEAGIGVRFSNLRDGKVNVTKGTLGFWGDTYHFGELNIESGATVQFGRSSGVTTHEWNEGATLPAGGNVLIGSFWATLEVNDAAGFKPDRLQSSGTIDLKDTTNFTVVGDLILDAGIIQGPGRLRINGTFDWPYWASLQAGGGIDLYGGGTVSGGWIKDIRSRTIRNYPGSVWNWVGDWAGAGISFRLGDTTIENGGTVDIQTDISCSGEGGGTNLIWNTGTITKTNGSGTATISVPFVNDGQILVARGTLAFNGGYYQKGRFSSLILSNNATVSATSNLVIGLGSVRGLGNVNANLDIWSSQTLAPGFDRAPGTLVVNGNLDMHGIMEVHIGGEAMGEYDHVAVPTHALILYGYLEVNMMNGYVPNPTNEFIVAWSHTLSGSFANVASGDWLDTADGNGRFRVYYGSGSPYDANRVVLTDFEPDCTDPAPVLAMICPSDMLVYTSDPNGTEVSFNIGVGSSCGTPWVNSEPASGSRFNLGTTTVDAHAILNNHTQECSFTVEVRLGTPTITDQPDSVLVSAGYPATFSVSATGPDLQYHWRHNGTPVGGNSPTLAIPAAATSDAGTYSVVVSNAYGTVTSSEVNLSVVAGVITNELVVHLKFDGNYSDSSGRGNHATAVNSPTFDSGGRIGEALRFSGEDGENRAKLDVGGPGWGGQAPADLRFGETNDFTISFWYNVEFSSIVVGDGEGPVLLGNGQAHTPLEGDDGYVFWIDYAGKLRWTWNNWAFGEGTWGFESEAPSADGAWHHVVWSVQRGIHALTVFDGRLVDTMVSIPPRVYDIAVNIGRENSHTSISQSGYTTGALIDDVGFWRRALSPEEAVAIYSAGYSGKTLAEAEVKPPYDSGGKVPIQFAEGKVTMVFAATPGYLYDVQRTLSLSPAAWVTLTTASPLTPGPDGAITFTDPSPPSGGAYYRLVPR